MNQIVKDIIISIVITVLISYFVGKFAREYYSSRIEQKKTVEIEQTETTPNKPSYILQPEKTV